MNDKQNDSDEVSLTEELLRRKETNILMIVFLSSLVILSAINMMQFSSSIYDDAFNARTGDEWLVDFDSFTTTYEVEKILQDDEVYLLEIYPSELDFPPDSSMGLLEIEITPEETAGASVNDPLGQCDSISATLNKNDFTAQWDDERNDLSGQDSDCEVIYLSLVIYPNFTGNSSIVTVANEYQALMEWTDKSWGVGIIELVLELDTNYIQEFGVVTEDSEEELTISYRFTSFNAKASLVNS